MYYNNPNNRFNSRKPDSGFSVRFARQLGVMFIVLIFLLLIKFTDNEITQKVNVKLKTVFYGDLTEEATEVFKSRLGDSVTFLDDLSEGESMEFFIDYLPVEGKITKNFGKIVNPTTKKEELHNGIEIEVTEKTDIKCVFSGVVDSIDLDTAKGNTVTIAHQGGFKTVYKYLTDLSITEGDTLEKGNSIGKLNKVANAKTMYLYFELQKNGAAVNPSEYMKALTN